MSREIVTLATFDNYEPRTYGGAAAAVTGGGQLILDNLTSNAGQVISILTTSGKVVSAFCCTDWLVEYAGESADDVRFAFGGKIQVGVGPIPTIFLLLGTKNVSSTKYKFQLSDDDGMTPVVGSTEFTYGTEYDWRIITDSTNWMFDVDGTEEIKTPDSRVIIKGANGDVRLLSDGATVDATKKTKARFAVLCGYDSTADRPSATMTGSELTLNGESATHTDYNRPATDGSDPDNNDVDDWESGSDDDGTTRNHIASASGVTALQAYTTVNYTPVNDQRAVAISVNHAAQVGEKSATGNIFTYDGTSIEHGSSSSVTNSYTRMRRLFRLAPDGGTWESADLDPLELGHRTITDVGEDIERINLSAIHGEVIDIADDPVISAPAQRSQVRMF